MIDLDKLEQVAKAAQDPAMGAWDLCIDNPVDRAFVHACSPDVVLALVAKIREHQRLQSHLEMLLRDAATDHESDVYEAHKEGRREGMREAAESLRTVKAERDALVARVRELESNLNSVICRCGETMLRCACP